ncbi:MerR family transcriptional regulator [Streptococcus dentiloxodontae]
MSFYTTGELAKACQVSVRTVQYYDKRGILIPSSISEGGRRLYSEEDLKRLHMICFLRELDFSIEHIKTILAERNAKEVLALLLKEHIQSLQTEISDKQNKLDRAVKLSKDLTLWSKMSPETMTTLTNFMEERKKYHQFYRHMIILGFFGNIVIWLGLWLSFQWQTLYPFVIGFGLACLYTFILVKSFYQQVSYICPECDTVFKANFKEFLFASHTLRTRRLTCPACHIKSHCIEILDEKEKRHVS